MSAPVDPQVPSSPTQFAIGTRLFLQVIAAVHLIAFLSFWWQWRGLLGPQGLFPASRFLAAAYEQLGGSAYLRVPSLCWIFGAEHALPIVCAVGIAAAVALFIGCAPAICLALLWTLYLSLVSIGQQFFSFQWDALLLESTLLAIPLAPWTLQRRWGSDEPPPLARWLLWWLLIRLMLLSGAVKLLSGDPTWRDLSALTFHFETQPLPTPLAWYVQLLPAAWLRAACAGMFVIEFVAPLCLLGPRTLRHRAALFLIALQVGIALTGNYTFFNLLTAGLCLLCFDDRAWRRVLRLPEPTPRLQPAAPVLSSSESHLPKHFLPERPALGLPAFAAFVGVVTLAGTAVSLTGRMPPAPLDSLLQLVAPFQSLNNYGLFAVMTHPRTELIVEGSNDDRTWLAYEFPYKPGDPARRPTFVAPYQPRLDWHLWFAALDSPANNPWVAGLCEHLLMGTPDVLSLVKKNPFPAHPPKYIRVQRYEYHFTDRAERKRTGNWWRRSRLDDYVPASSLTPE